MTDFTAAAAQFVADQALLHAVVHGPSSGGTSLVDLGGGVIVKTLARINAESAAWLVNNAAQETVATPAIAAGSVNVDLALASVFKIALNANITAFNILHAIAGMAMSFVVEFTADGTLRTITDPGGVVDMTGTYVPTSTNGKKDHLVYETIDGGTTWRRYILWQNV